MLGVKSLASVPAKNQLKLKVQRHHPLEEKTHPSFYFVFWEKFCIAKVSL